MKNKLLKETFRISRIIGAAILFAVCLRVFFFASFKIPTPSMRPAILSGDYILVNKLIVGPRVYKNANFLKGGKIEYFRLKGLREIRKNDVLVFNYPYSDPDKLEPDPEVFYVKRCLAVPGDTLSVVNGFYRVNDSTDTLGCYAFQLKLSERADSAFRDDVFHCFPYDTLHQWTVKNFGPLYVPGKDDTLPLTRQNLSLYGKLVEYETGQPVSARNDTVYVGKEIVKYYTFRQNYYFMAGDFATDSRDSRYWGLLPEDHVVGKAVLIWKSQKMRTGEYRWDRFFKIIQ